MSINRRTLEEARRARIAIDRSVDATTRELVIAWGRAWGETVDAYAEAIDDLIKVGDGKWPPRYKINRAQRAQRALALAARELDQLGKQAGVTISRRLSDLVHQAVRWEQMIARTQLPPGEDFTGARLSWTEPDEDAIRSMVKRSTTTIENQLNPLSRDAQQVMKRELIRGTVIGDNPRVAARRMIERTEGAFNGGLARANNIARTEMLDAYRSSALETRKRNRSVLRGWTWMATLDHRTCGSCLAQHGSFHPVGEPGPLDHQQGRCTAITVTKTWADLGFDAPEPAPVNLPDAEAWFNAQPVAVQRSILGPTRLELYRNGQLSFSDLSKRKRNPNWRSSYGVPALR